MKKIFSLFLVFFIFSCSNNDLNFWYKEPLKDENGYLLAREDLKKAEEVKDWYSSIKELFTKLNSINETQVEPLYKPIYNWENLPTFIIIWDFHADEYNLEEKDTKQFKVFLGKDHLIEKNEDANSEVKVVEMLNKKFWIKTIWIENEFFESKESISLIWKWVTDLWLKYIWLETTNEQEEEKIGEVMIKNILLGLEMEKLDWKNLNVEVTEEEANKIIEDPKIKEILKEETKNYEEMEKVLKENKSDDEKVKIIYDLIKKSYEKWKEKYRDDKELDIKSLKYLKYLLNKMHGEWFYEYLLEELENNQLSKDLDENFLNQAKNMVEYDKLVIEQRNKNWVEIISKNLDDKKIAIMVYGKGHIDGLIKELKKKYENKVNIYVAK